MVRPVLRWSAVSLAAIIAAIGGFVAYLYASPVPFHEFDATWYHTDLHLTAAAAQTFRATHRSALYRAQADHMLRPIGPSRIITLFRASSPTQSGEVFLFFECPVGSSDAALHYFPVYCWSEPRQRLLWKGLQDNSP